MSDPDHVVKVLGAQQIQHAVSLAEDAGMAPNTFDELDFFRKNETSEFVGLFAKQPDGNATDDDNDNDVPMGVAGLLHDEERDFLVLLVVNKHHRRKGVGQKLVQWAIDASRQQGKAKVLQLVASKMGSPLYKKLGFIETGYSSNYEIKKCKVKRLDTSKQHTLMQSLVSLRIEDVASEKNGGILWSQASEMLLQASGSRARTIRTTSLLEKSTIHILCDPNDELKVKAWGAIRQFSEKGRVIGPIIGKSVEAVVELVQGITLRESELKTKVEGEGEEEEEGDQGETFVIHTDGQSGQEPTLARALKSQGWECMITLEVLELPLKEEGLHHTVKTDDGAKQFALTDFSHQ